MDAADNISVAGLRKGFSGGSREGPGCSPSQFSAFEHAMLAGCTSAVDSRGPPTPRQSNLAAKDDTSVALRQASPLLARRSHAKGRESVSGSSLAAMAADSRSQATTWTGAAITW